jgi:hypothetical protein
MTIAKPKILPHSSSASTQPENRHGGADIETRQSTDNHAGVEQQETFNNPLIEGTEGGQPRDGRGSVEGDMAAD